MIHSRKWPFFFFAACSSMQLDFCNGLSHFFLSQCISHSQPPHR
jgi:hypothetical protein